jgi:hypothetical protein
MTKPRSLQLLLGTDTAIVRLLEHVQLLQSLDKRLHACLDTAAAGHAQVADLNSDRLIIHASSAAWATRLRYLTPQLLRCLRTSPSLTNLNHIEVKVSPPTQPPTQVALPAALSADSAAILDSTADAISDPALRAVLRRLARRGRDNSAG